MKLTIALCTYRRFEWLAKCIAALKRQSLSVDQYKIIVVDNSLELEKSESFRDSLKGFSNLEYIITQRAGLSYARNVALKKCDTPYIAYIDDDALAAPDWAEKIVIYFEIHHGVGVIGGKVDPIWETERPQWLKGRLLHQLAILDWGDEDLFIDENMWLVGANVAYRTHVLRAVNGFSSILGRTGSLLLAHEELAVNMAIKALGYDVMFCPAVKVEHLIQAVRMTREWFCLNMLWEGASRVLLELGTDHVDLKALSSLMEKTFTTLSSESILPDTTEGLLDVGAQFNVEGRKQCRQLLGIETDERLQLTEVVAAVIYVVTPCMNATSTIDQTIASVLTQAGDFSIRYHIQDGGSTDGTLKKINRWKQRLEDGSFPLFCKNIVFTYASEPDNGMYDAISKGFDSMFIPSASFMGWINADDIFLPFAFDHIANIDKNFSEKVLWLGGHAALIDENRKLWRMHKRVLPNDIIKSGLCDGQNWDFVQQEGTFFRGSLWTVAKEKGVFDGFKLAGDWNLWRILAQRSRYYQLSWPLGAFRLHEGQISQEHREEYQAEIDATINPTKRREAFMKLTSQENLSVYVIKEDPQSGELIAIGENGIAAAADYRQRFCGTVVSPQVQPPVFQTPSKDDKVQPSPPPPIAVSALPAGSKKTQEKPQQISKSQSRQFVSSIFPDPTKIVFGPGWHDQEGDEKNWWRWSSQSGIVHLKTDRGGKSNIFFSVLSQHQENVIRLYLNGHVVNRISTNRDESSVSPIKVRLKRGTNVLEIVSDMDSVVSQRDPRPLNFMVKNLDFIPAKGQGAKSSLKTTIRKIEQSGLFFSSYYKKQVPELPQQQSPIEHYCLYGAWEGKNPNHFFDTAFYLDQNYKLYITGKNPLLHYLEIGWQQGRDPHPEFSTNRYLNAYSEVKKSGVNPLVHYLKYGVLEDRNPFPPPKFPLECFQGFTFSKRSHWDLFAGSDKQLFGKAINLDECTLKKYQDLFVFTFIKDNVPPNSRILDVGGGHSRILRHFADSYECWNIDKMEGVGNGPKQVGSAPYKLVLDYMGNFNKELPDASFDFVFSISALEHTPEDKAVFDNIIKDIDRVMKPGSYSLHLFDVLFKPNGEMWTNSFVDRIFNTVNTVNKMISPASIKDDSDLYSMSEEAYNRNWINTTKLKFSEFGNPASLNILWRKPL